MRIARLRVQGKSYKEIGVLLGISPKTVSSHMDKLYMKLKVHNVAQLIGKLSNYNKHDDDDI